MRHLGATMVAKNTLWMCVALAAGILAAFLVVVLGTPTKPAEAAFPGRNGKIVFVSQLGGPNHDFDILTMKANGDNKTRLTTHQLGDFNPVFSANGKKIAFTSAQSRQSLDIFTMSANGTDTKQVTTRNLPEFEPAWSPAGTRIAFSTRISGNEDIYVINKDGSGLTRLTASQQPDREPAWSPDGTRIAFVRGEKIYVMKAARESATNIPQRLTTSGSGVDEHAPAWSPNGNRIAFASDQTGDSELYSIRADGSGQNQLTNSPNANSFEPAWSPDGNKIAFSRVGANGGTSGIYIMKAAPESATNRPKRLTGNRSPSFEPDWQPLR
jgi:Tol biopolymer transport system component